MNTTLRPARAVLALVTAGALLVAACGGDDDDTATEAPADTEAPAGTEAPAATEAPADTTPTPTTEAPADTTPTPTTENVELEHVDLSVGVVGISVAQVPLYAAIQNGYLEDEAISAEITALQGSGGQAMAALVSDSVDVLSAGSTTFANAVGTDAVDAKMFYQFAAATADVVGREGLATIDDLPEGATIGITGPGSQDQVWFQYAVAQQGLDPDSFTYVAAGPTAERLAGLQAGAYDAVAVAAQFRNQYGSGVILIDGVDAGLSFPAVLLGATTDKIASDSDVLVRLVRAMNRGAVWAREPANRDAAVELCVEYTQASPEVCGASLDGFLNEDPQFTISPTGVIDEAGIRSTLEIFGAISPDMSDLSYEVLVDPSIVEQAAG